MRLLVVGAGSTGGYFGGRLVQAGRDVTFLVRPRRAAQLQERGLQIVSPHGDAIVRPKLVTTDDIDAPYDAVLLAVKAYSLDAAIDDFAAAVGPETTVVPVLNGMRHVDILQERFGKEAVGGGVCKVATTIDSDGRIVQLATFQELAYGERDGAVSPRMEEFDAFMRGAGFDARLSRSIEYEMWEKWVLLATLGGITCLMRGDIGEVVAPPGGASFLAPALRKARFQPIRQRAVPIVNMSYSENSFSALVAKLIAPYVVGRGAVTPEEANDWLAEFADLERRGEY